MLVSDTEQVVPFISLDRLKVVPFRIFEVNFYSEAVQKDVDKRHSLSTYPVPGAGRVISPCCGTKGGFCKPNV